MPSKIGTSKLSITFIQMRVKEKNNMAIITTPGVLLDILRKISPEYKPNLFREKKEFMQLVVRFQNNLYGKIVSKLIYYHKFTKSLMGIGFEINPYDPCVDNNMIGRLQIKICFHVDSFELIHWKRNTNDCMISGLSNNKKLSLRMDQGICQWTEAISTSIWVWLCITPFVFK